MQQPQQNEVQPHDVDKERADKYIDGKKERLHDRISLLLGRVSNDILDLDGENIFQELAENERMNQALFRLISEMDTHFEYVKVEQAILDMLEVKRLAQKWLKYDVDGEGALTREEASENGLLKKRQRVENPTQELNL